MSEQPATESLSIEDRIVNQFEPEQPEVEAPQEQQAAPEEEGAPESEAQPEFAEIEFEGKAYQVPPEIKDALLRQSDYTKKTTEVSERQRAIEQKEYQLKAVEMQRKFDDSAREDIAKIQELDWSLKQLRNMPVANLSEIEYRQLRERLDQIKEERAELSNNLTAKWNGFQQHQQQLMHEAMQKAQEHISKSIKGWGAEAQKAIREHALTEGFTGPELDAMSDPRLVKVLWKSAQFDKLQRATTEGRAKPVPTVKPGSSNPMPQHVKDQFAQKKQLSSAKTSSEKAKVIQKMLESRF
jgi:hypothetical protein